MARWSAVLAERRHYSSTVGQELSKYLVELLPEGIEYPLERVWDSFYSHFQKKLAPLF
jgi:hypothetical protein